MRRLGVVLACAVALSGCADTEADHDELSALVPQLDMALAVISQAVECPAPAEAVEFEFDPIEVGSLEQHGQRLPDQVVLDASMSLVQAGERARVAIWTDATLRPVAMLVLWEFEDGDFGLRRIRYCRS